MKLNELRDMVHQAAREKGWWEPDKVREPGTLHMLMVSELAEATEEVRKGTPPVYFETPTGRVTADDIAGVMILKVGDVPQKPEGELIELADCIIRILDYCGGMGYDIEQAVIAKHRYNLTRSHRHGGKAF